jgi:outer membrane protein assembly factor BamB
MNRSVTVFSLLLLLTVFTLACGHSFEPASPQISNPELQSASVDIIEPGHSLLGYYSVAINPSTLQATVIPIRTTSWHLNAVKFLEPSSSGSLISFSNLAISGHQVDIDVTIKHPFPGMPYYAGFDVKGIAIGSADVIDPNDETRVWAGGPDGLRLMNADGWTRWWNPSEFPDNGKVFSYRDGVAGIPAAVGGYNARLSGYKVFASALEKNDPITKLLAFPLTHPNGRATFPAGSIATRHYCLVFPGNASGGPDLLFNYAVDACHGFADGYKVGDPIEVPDGFPPDANQLEPFILDTNIKTNTLYLLPGGCMGGVLEFDIRVSDWQALLAGTPVSQQVSSVTLTSPSLFVGMRTPELISDSTPSYPWATYRMKLDGLTPDSSLDQQIMVTVISSEGDYQPKVSSYQGSSPLASYFLVRVPISSTGPIGSSGFQINALSPWPISGGNHHNSNLSIAHGPEDPAIAWGIEGLTYSGKPVIDAEGRIFVPRDLAGGGVTLMVLGSEGLPNATIDLPGFEPGGDPVVVGCSLLWSDRSGNVIRIFSDGSYEDVFQIEGGSGPNAYGQLNLDDNGRAFVHGASGMQAFDENGGLLWKMTGEEDQLSMLLGPSTLAGQNAIVVGELEIEDSANYVFKFRALDAKTGGQKWEFDPGIPNSMAFGCAADTGAEQVYFNISDQIIAIRNDGAQGWVFKASKDLSPIIGLSKTGIIYTAEVGGTPSNGDKIFKLLALSKNGEYLWSTIASSPISAGPIVDADGEIYFATRDAEVYCINPDGSLKWYRDYAGRTAYLTFGPSGSLLLGLIQPQYTTSVLCLKDDD